MPERSDQVLPNVGPKPHFLQPELIAPDDNTVYGLKFVIRCQELPRFDFFFTGGRCDAYFLIENSKGKVLYMSECIKNDLTPVFSPAVFIVEKEKVVDRRKSSSSRMSSRRSSFKGSDRAKSNEQEAKAKAQAAAAAEILAKESQSTPKIPKYRTSTIPLLGELGRNVGQQLTNKTQLSTLELQSFSA